MQLNVNKSVFMAVFLLFTVSLNQVYGAEQNQAGKLMTAAELQQKIEHIDKQNVSPDIKKRILALYDDVSDNLKEIAAQEIQTDVFKKIILNLPVENKRLAQQIADSERSLKNHKSDKFALFPSDELEQRLIVEKTALADLDAEINQLEGEINEQINRQSLIREKISDLKNKQLQNQQEQKELLLKKSVDNLLEKSALQMRLDSRQNVLSSTLKTLELESISDPQRLQNKKDRMHLLNLHREQISMVIADLDGFLLDRRQLAIDKEQAELTLAAKAVADKHSLLQAATKENIQFNLSLRDVNKKIEQYQAQKNEFEQRNSKLEKDFQSAEQKINLAGLSPALGNLLREQRRNLPQRKNFGDLNDALQTEIAQASLELFKLEEAKKNLNDVAQALNLRIAQQLGPELSDAEKINIRSELRLLLSDQKELVNRLDNVYAEYARVLGDVDFSLQQMLTNADKFSAFLDQRLLWVPSAPVIDKYYLKDIVKSLLWFISLDNWQKLGGSFWNGLLISPWQVVVGLGIIAANWRLTTRIKNELNGLLHRQSASHEHYFSFGETLQGLGYLLVLSVYAPLLMIWMGSVLAFSGNVDFFSYAVAVGLFKAAVSLCLIQFFYRLFKPAGVAEVLFQWDTHIISLLFSQFKWMRFVLVPCVFITAMTGSDVFSEHSLALGRTALIIMMLAMATMLHRLTLPATGLGSRYYRQEQGWIYALRYLWYSAAVLTPLVIIGFAVAGYYQSALELEGKLVLTLRLIFITVLFHELAQHWLAVTKRQLAIQDAKQKRRQDEHTDVVSLEGDIPIAEPKLDIYKISQQSDKLLTTVTAAILLVGCWMIWSDILTAFSILDHFVLWQHSQLLDGKESLQPITLTNLLFSLVYAALAFVIVGNFPTILDLLLVGKLEISPGSRYALIQLARYGFIAIAFLAMANEIGGSWSQVQWLVAALSVGLGFGLQEIFANMVSGIILLFEQPIRVGDTVTVGDVTGRVSRIQMRATHIVDYDRKELVVPNKIFITDRLINWTLSDTVSRLVLTIGVVYGTDIDVVEEVFREAIKQTELVLLDPEPKIVFHGFGESSLDFNIYVFVNELNNRLTIRHNLQKNIYNALRAHHIEIPFPQRDLHIRSGLEGGIGNSPTNAHQVKQ
jgi:potassium efflux system protein